MIFKKHYKKFLLGFVIYFIYLAYPRIWHSNDHLLIFMREVVNLSGGNLNADYVRIGFDDTLSNRILGVCNRLNKEIRINPNQWKKASLESKTILIAHELYHCGCMGLHIEGSDNWGCPNHFMAPSDGGEWCNKKNISKYIKQMRTIKCDERFLP
jgi:hypothetical protein